MSFVVRSFCANSCNYLGTCYNDSGAYLCLCDDPDSFGDCALTRCLPWLPSDPVPYLSGALAFAFVVIIVLVSVVVGLGVYYRRAGHSDKEMVEMKMPQQSHVQENQSFETHI
ncbi:unnamed protein product [Heligmosomoides polygyrus]|uniref:EGF-like domain-containing protein n=1 Tax=Heligmosomoides polygyrus TaxID=6339 RepID=A0A183G3J7_HELPZ|nr:unnamed protein product [Heligmosomoides polygyrus]